MPDPRQQAAEQALVDPTTPAVALAQIVSEYPLLGHLAARHPNAYPALIDWVQQNIAPVPTAAQTGSAVPSHPQHENPQPPASAPTTVPAERMPEADPPPQDAAPHPAETMQDAEVSELAPAPSSDPAPHSAPAPSGSPAGTPPVPRRRRGLLVGALAVVAALVVAAAAVTGTLAVNRAVAAAEQSSAAGATGADDPDGTTGADSDPGSAADDDTDGQSDGGSPGESGDDSSGGVLPYTDTASSAADLADDARADETGPIVLVLDASGSMLRLTSGDRNRMDDARNAMTEAIGLLPDSAEVGLLVFGTGTGNDESEREHGCEDVKTVQPLGALDRDGLASALDGIEASGFTPLGPSMRTAAEMLPADGPGTIVLVSDGVDTCSPPPACEVASDLRAANPQLTIHSVGFAIDDDEQAQQQLQCIGRVGGGGYISAANVQQLGPRVSRAAGVESDAVLSDRGFGGVRLGMPLDEVRGLPGFEIVDERTIDGIEYVYVDCSWGTIEFRAGVAAAIAPTHEVATLDGVAVGNAISRAADVYGDPVDSGEDDYGSFGVYRISDDSPYAYRVYGDDTITKVIVCACLPDDGEFASWEATFDGLGPIRLGMTVDEVLTVLPDALPYAEPSPSDMQWTDVVTWTPFPDQPWLRVDVIDGAVAGVTASARALTGYPVDYSAGSALPHMRGIRIGDSVETAANVMPGGTDFGFHAAAIYNYVVSDRLGRSVVFATDGSKHEWLEARQPGARVDEIRVIDASLESTYAQGVEAENVPRSDAGSNGGTDDADDFEAAAERNGFPVEFQGEWCPDEKNTYRSECFSVDEWLAENPDGFLLEIDKGSAWYEIDGTSSATLCSEGTPGGGCTATATTMILTYYPPGVPDACEEAVKEDWSGCWNDFDYDTSQSRLVFEALHQHCEPEFCEGELMYRKGGD
ncbi:vWA domain-containing protein [Microbacterium halotolerans]|uniref:vWA domain-containing protein n=1 Tax=Microbacterium halotolerans TaxID=246613 RepID=UPI0013C31340|nr:VWA domain-containing protein [Microbacterium halotolerans]